MFQDVFWVLTPCTFLVGHVYFRGPCRLSLQGELTGIEKWHRQALNGRTAGASSQWKAGSNSSGSQYY